MSEPETVVVFVYGTLQPGEPRWGLLQPFVEDEPRPASVPGRLFDTGRGYPAAVFAADSGAVVPGAVVAIRAASVGSALTVLDQVEGTGFGLYERVLVTTTDGESAWAYAWQGDCDDLTPIEAWGANAP